MRLVDPDVLEDGPYLKLARQRELSRLRMVRFRAKRRKPRFWTAERIALLKKLWGELVPCREIANALGCTKNAVVGKADRLNLPDRSRYERWGHSRTPTIRDFTERKAA